LLYLFLSVSTCFGHYLLILGRHCINGTWYIACVLCQLAAPGLKWKVNHVGFTIPIYCTMMSGQQNMKYNITQATREPGQFSRYSDSLRTGRSGDRIPAGGERFSARTQTDNVAHLPSYTMGTGYFPGVKRPGRGADDPPTFSAKVKERVVLCLYSPSGHPWLVLR
jgi:hypothetical protein